MTTAVASQITTRGRKENVKEHVKEHVKGNVKAAYSLHYHRAGPGRAGSGPV